MCGIAGYSLSASSDVERTLAAQALLAGIAERGADAVGYAYVAPGGGIAIHKQRSGASALLEQVVLPESVNEVLVHVRDYTKGHPRIEANNHPIRHGTVVGVHNGIIFNDDELMASHGFDRAEPQMTVDSEAIFARPRLWVSCGARWRRPGSTSAVPERSSSPAASAARSGSARAARRLSLPRPRQLSRWSSVSSG
jgi:glutamine phosphoribosylpyrophosphate amidotransferase